MSDRFVRALQSRPYLLADGAMGTNLFAMGLQSGEAPELWGIQWPEKLAELHRRFIEAGSDVVLTNSFGGTRYRLQLHNAQHRVAEVNEGVARVAREVADAADRDVLVAGSIGPTGELFAPLGTLTALDAQSAFAEQAQALVRGGVDVLWIETLSSPEELEAAIAGAAIASVPIVCTLSFDTNGHTMMGMAPPDLVRLSKKLSPNPVAYGANCGIGPAELVASILAMSAVAEPGDILVAKANCGIPEFVGGAIRYTGTPKLMAKYATVARDAGARIIGGCCGTTPEHIAAMRASLASHEVGPRPDMAAVSESLGTISKGAEAQHRRGDAPGPAPDRRRRRARRQDSRGN